VQRHLAVSLIGTALIMSRCSNLDSEPTASNSAAITVQPNYPAVLFNMHYADAVSATDPGTFTSHWLVAYDNCSRSTPGVGYLQCDPNYGWIGWSVSSDITGSTWSPNIPPPGWEQSNWIPPGSPSTGGTFLGWGGDPTIALIGNVQSNASLPPDGTRVLMASLAISNLGGGSYPSDVATLLSSDGGQTWATPRYVSTAIAGGVDVDQPQVVTNSSPPYSTVIAWSSNTTSLSPPPEGWILSIDNTTYMPGSSTAPGTWNINSPTGNAFSAKKIMNQNNNAAIRPKIAVGSIPWTGGNGCNGGTHELIYAVWTTNPFGRVCGIQPPQSVSWNMAIFDNTANAWAPTTYNIANDAAWPTCVGSGPNGFDQPLADIDNAALVTDGNIVAIAHNQSTPRGARISLHEWSVTCSNGQLQAVPANLALSPDPCYVAGLPSWCPQGYTGPNGPGGTNIVNDQWGPKLAFQKNNGVPYLLVTWYDTQGDPTNGNVHINGAMNTTGITGNPFWVGTTSTIFPVSVAGSSSETVPWGATLGLWWDYQGLGVDPVSHSFLAAWGGDARFVNTTANGPSGVWTARITTP